MATNELLNPCEHIITITLNGISHSQHHISILKDTRGALQLSGMSTQVAVWPSQMSFVLPNLNSSLHLGSLGNYSSWKEPKNHDQSVYVGKLFPSSVPDTAKSC